jgi:hypothetical protein
MFIEYCRYCLLLYEIFWMKKCELQSSKCVACFNDYVKKRSVQTLKRVSCGT